MTVTTSVRGLQTLGQIIKSVRFHGPEDLRLDEVVAREPGPCEARIRPLACGLCGTDQHILHGDFPAASPVILGHEVAGVVDALGDGFTGLKEGDLVSVQPNTYCGMCRHCRAGREHLCSRLRAYGVHLDGGFSEAMVAKASALYRLPNGTNPQIGCLAEPLACCIHGIDRAGIRSGSRVFVIGAGLIGLMLTRLARLAGAGLIVVGEPQQTRRAQAIEFGADKTLDSTSADGEAAAMVDSNAEGFDLVIDAVGSRGSFEQAVRIAARGGSILVFGVAAPSTISSVSPFDIYARELTILGSFINPYTHERAISLLPQMHLEKLRINRFSMASYREAFRAQSSSTDSAKVVILPQE